MTKKTINIGTGELAGDGESLRSAFSKANENFDELYSTKADATSLPKNVSELTNDAGYITQDAIPTDFKGTVAGNDSTILVDGVNSSINLDGTVKGNIVPDADSVYDLGSTDRQFRSLYVSSNTIFVGGAALGVNKSGQIQIQEEGVDAKVATQNYVNQQLSAAVIDANGVDLFGYVQTGDNVSDLTNDANYVTETYVDTAETDAIATAAADATTKANAAQAAAEATASADATTKANAAQAAAEATAAADATTKADAALVSAQTYADTAEADAVTTAATDATTKANTAEANANAYTDTRETAITTAYQTYADTAETDAVATANAYTDTKETAITSAYQAYADSAQSDAENYADGIVNIAVTALQGSISAAEDDAISSAQTYTDTQISSLVGTSPATLNTIEELAQALGDDPNAVGTITTGLANRVRTDVDNQGLSVGDQSNARTNIGLGTAATQDTGAFATAAQGTLADSALQDASIFATAAQGTTADNALPAASVSAFGETLIDDLDAGAARTTLGLGTAATTASTDYATAAQGALADSAIQSGDNISELVNDSGYVTNSDIGNFASEAYVDQAEADAITTANAYTDTRETAITSAYQTYADTAETDAVATANIYTDTRESAITTAYQTYADAAQAAAEATAAADATTKANTAEANANAYTDAEISNLIDSAPGAIDTLNELAAALGDDANFAANITTTINNNKADTNNKFTNLINIAGDDSTQISVSQGETIKLAGGVNITTATDAAGNVTIDGVVQDLYDLGITDGLNGYVLSTDGAEGVAFTSPDTFGGNRIYVSAAKGNDANNGTDLPVASLKRALQLASDIVYNGDNDVVGSVTVMVASGDYILDNPVIIPDSVSIVGDNLRRVIFRPQNANVDMFRVRNNSYITNVTFRDTADLTSTFRYAISFDDVADTNTSRVGYTNLPTAKPLITTSPYIQNCSVISFLGAGGVEIDGDLIVSPNVPANAAEAENPQVDGVPEYGKSMVANAFTILSFGGTAWRVINDAYAQIVSCFVIFTEQGCLTQNGGYLSITNSATNFGLFALRSTGYSPNSFTFDRGYIAGNGITDGLQTLRAVGLGKRATEQYVLRFRNSIDADITDTFNSNGSLGVSADWVASTDSVSGSSITFTTAHGLSTGDIVEYDSNSNREIIGLYNELTYYAFANNANTITLYHDSARTRPVRFLDDSVTSGTHVFKSGYEEFFVDEVVESHNTYQDIVLEAGIYTPVIGDTIIGTDASDTITAIISAWDNGTRTLTVSIELTDGQRNKFTTSSTINAGELVAGAVDIDGVTDRSDLFTTNFIVGSTQDRTVQSIGSLNSNQVYLHRPSILNSSAHTWEYAGSGTDYNALPQNGGETDSNFEQVSSLPGRVYASGTTELGDFKIGDFVTAENRSGNITFRNTVTISELDNITLKRSPNTVISQISIDNTLGDNEVGGANNERISTQLAVKDFITDKVGTFFNKSVSTNALPNAVVQLNAQGKLNTNIVPTTSGFTSFTVDSEDGRLDLHLDIPAKDLRAGNIVIEEYNNGVADVVDNYFLANDNLSQFLKVSTAGADFTDIISNDTTITSTVAGAVVTASAYQEGVLTGIDVNTIAGSGYITDGTFVGVTITSTFGINALADITIAGGAVTGIDLTRGGTRFADGDTIAADAGTGTPPLPTRSGGVGLSATVSTVENRLFVDIDQNVGIPFVSNTEDPDFIADDNAPSVTVTDLEAELTKAFDSTTTLSGGDVDYTANQITITTHTFVSGDIVRYAINGNVNIGGLTDGDLYYVKAIDADTIELYTNYSLSENTKVDFTTQGSGTHNFTRVTVGLNTIRLAAHGLTSGTPVRVSGTDVPNGITSNDFVYIGSVTTNTFTLHAIQSDATNSTNGTTINEVVFTDSGTGSLTFTTQNISIVGQVNTSGSDTDAWGSLNTTTIDAGNIVSGTISPDRLGSGTANEKTFLRGDSSYADAVQGIVAGNGIVLTGDDSKSVGDDTVYFNQIDIRVDDATSASAGTETKGIASFDFTNFDVTNGKVTIKDDSHNHIISNIDGLSTAISDAETGAVTTANAYTDTRETAITTAYQSYTDAAETDAVTTANAYTDTSISNLVNGAPGQLDTLNELSAALGDDSDFANTITALVGTNKSESDSKFANLFTIGADDSTLQTVSQSESITFIGGTNISTASDGEGNITITGVAQDFAFSSLTGTPTTLSGYGITDAATSAQGALADSALQSVAFSDLTTTPTTIAGYGITDAFDGAYSSLTGTPTLGTLASLSTVNAATITDNSVGAAELNVSGNGTSGQALVSDGDGTFSWGAAGAALTNDTTTNTTQYIGMSRTTSGSWTSAYVADSKLYFNPSSGELTATDFNSLSDANAKTNVQTIENSLDIVDRLRGVTFDWKDTGEASLGMIAQEVEQVLPMLVSTGEEGEKRLKYANIVGVLVEAVKQLSKRVEDLENGV